MKISVKLIPAVEVINCSHGVKLGIVCNQHMKYEVLKFGLTILINFLDCNPLKKKGCRIRSANFPLSEYYEPFVSTANTPIY